MIKGERGGGIEGSEHEGWCQKSISGSQRDGRQEGSPFDTDVFAESLLQSPQKGTHLLVVVDIETSAWGA